MPYLGSIRVFVRVVELGSHEELMARKGRYQTMFDLQASRFGEAEEEGLDVLD